MKKKDWILIGLILVVSLGVFVYQSFRPAPEEAEVLVTVHNEWFGTYSLDVDQTIDINGTNQLSIQDGKADMVSADCPNQLCVHEKAISKQGESIICLPNQTVVTVQNAEDSEFDAVAN